MKLFLFFAALLLAGCTPNAQLVTLRGDNVTPGENGLIMDTDTLTLSYSFFSERGLMKLTVYNKLTVPLFIDWKHSAFIIGSDKFDYWHDVADVELSGSSYRLYRYANLNLSGTITKDDPVGFIPPQTKLVKQQFIVLPRGHLKLSGQPALVQEIAYSSLAPGRKRATVPNYTYTPATSPYRFRNFLTLSTQRDFQREFYIDTRFYAADVRVMRAAQLGYQPTYFYQADQQLYHRRRSPDSFYLFTKSAAPPVPKQ